MMYPLASDREHILDHTLDLWPDLRGGRVFLTGGTGFFGCWLLESFAGASDRLRLDCPVVVLTRSPEAFAAKAPHLAAHPSITLMRGDVRSFEFPGGSFSHVIHAATESSTALGSEQPLVMLDTIVDGTRRVLEFAAASGAKRFLLTSSGAVYGSQPASIEHLPETFPGAPDVAQPQTAYGEGKRIAELLCSIFGRTHGLECVVARCFAFVGPYLPLDVHFAIGNFIRDCLADRPIRIRGDGTPYRSYLHAADLAIWLWTMLLRGQPGRCYNVGSEQAVSIAELAATVAASLHASSEVRVEGKAVPGKLPERYVPQTARARDELGLSQWIPLDDAIRGTAAWYGWKQPVSGVLQ
jgi:dTDP-glucose 4,6-dehydratase